MNSLRHPSPLSPIEEPRDKASEKTGEDATPRKWEVDKATLENNPKIDSQLLSESFRMLAEFERLCRGAGIPIVKGANYRLSHPLGSNDVPSNSRLRGKKLNKVKKS